MMSSYGISHTLDSRPTARGDELEWVVTIHWGQYWLAENTAREVFASEEAARKGLGQMIRQHVPGH